MSKRRNREFINSVQSNNANWRLYYNRLAEIAMSRFEWKNLPPSVDERFMERMLLEKGQVLFFKDPIIGYMALPNITAGNFSSYGVPNIRQAYSPYNSYHMDLNNDDSVIIYANYNRTPERDAILTFSERLWDIDVTISTNIRAQKTPYMIQCDQDEYLSLKNLYEQISGNQSVVSVNKGLPTGSLKVFTTGAPYVADKLYDLKSMIWGEALTYLGVPNIMNEKKERMLTTEIQSLTGDVYASRYSPLNMRKKACAEINKMFGLSIDVNFRGEVNSDGQVHNYSEGAVLYSEQ